MIENLKSLIFKLGMVLALSLICTFSFAQLSGTYTINKGEPHTSSNYTSFQQAFDSLHKYGVSGPVVFEVVDTSGTYVGSTWLHRIPGTSSVNTVLFKNSSINNGPATMGTSNFCSSAVLAMDSCSYVTFDGLRINNFVSCQPIWLYDLNHHITFKNMKFFGHANGTSRAIYKRSTGKPQHDILIDSCEFSRFGIAIYFDSWLASVGGDLDSNNTVTNCSFDGTGFNCIYEKNGNFSNNNIYISDSFTSFSGNPTSMGFRIEDMAGGVIEKNRVHIQSNAGVRGIRVQRSGGYYSNIPVLIKNNVVTIDNRGTFLPAYGLYMYHPDSATIYQNTFVVNSDAANTSAIWMYSLDTTNYCRIKNNIFHLEKAGSSFSGPSTTTYPNHCDYNNWYFGSFDTSLLNIDTVKSFLRSQGMDSNSTFINPYFDSAHFRPFHAGLNAAGVSGLGITDDFDDDLRGSPPDIGADEFNPDPNSAALFALENTVYCSGVDSVYVEVENVGSNMLTSLEILWEKSINGGSWSSHETVNWSGSVANNNRAILNLGDYSFSWSDKVKFRYLIKKVNGLNVSQNHINSDSTPELHVGLSGTYSVGQPTDDFPTLDSAINVLNDRGICSSIIFELSDGYHYGHHKVNRFITRNDYDSVLFISKNEHKAILHDSTTSSPLSAKLLINGAKSLTFQDLKFEHIEPVSYTYVVFDSACSNIRFDNIIFGKNNYAISNNMSAQISNLTITNCVADSFNHFVSLYANDSGERHRNILLAGNSTRVTNLFFFIEQASNVTLEQNSFDNLSFVGQGREFGGFRNCDNIILSRNLIKVKSSTALYVDNYYADNPSVVLINNDIQQLENTSYTYDHSVVFRYCDLQLLHNSFTCYKSKMDESLVDAFGYTSTSVIHGNSFVNYGDGMSLSVVDYDSLSLSSNNFYSNGKRLVQLREYGEQFVEWVTPDSLNINVDPLFRPGESSVSNHPNFVDALEATIQLDLHGSPRDSLTDIGPYNLDSTFGNLELSGIQKGFCEGVNPIQFEVTNFGLDTVSNFQVQAYQRSIDSITWNPTGSQILSSSIPPGEKQEFSIDSFSIGIMDQREIKLEIKQVNSSIDSIGLFNELISDTIVSGISGDFIVGGTVHDFVNLFDALDTLYKRGLCGPVRLLVRDTIYKEQLKISAINGSSNINTLTIKSHPANSGKVRFEVKGIDEEEKCIIHIDNAANIVFDSLHIESKDAGIASDLVFASLIKMTNVVKNIEIYNTTLQDINTTAYRAHICLGDFISGSLFHCNRLIVSNCDFSKGTSPFRFGHFSQSWSNDYVKVTGSSFSDHKSYGGVIRCDSLYFNNNRFIDNGSGTCGFNLRAQYGEVDGNIWNANKGPVGGSVFTLFQDRDIDSNGAIWVKNNMINQVENSTGVLRSKMIYAQSGNVNIVHNSIQYKSNSIFASSNALFPMYHEDANIMFMNNNVVVDAMRPLFDFNFRDSIQIIDHNNYQVGFSGSSPYDLRFCLRPNIESLKEYKDSLRFDSNSISKDPKFLSNTNLRASSPYIWASGKFIAHAHLDIDSADRQQGSTDIGVNQVTRYDRNASLYWHDPLFCSDTQDIAVGVINEGVDTITSINLHWDYLDHNNQWQLGGSKIITTNLATFDSAELVISRFFMHEDSFYQFKFVIDSINHDTDQFNAEDSFETEEFQIALHGIYTVGNNNSDYSTIIKAVEALETRGICGPTWMNLEPRDFTKFLTIGSVRGTSQDNHLVFQSDPNLGGRARFVTKFNSSFDPPLDASGLSFAEFRNLSFVGFDNRNRTLCFIEDCKNVSLRNDSIYYADPVVAGPSIIVVNGECQYITIDSCIIREKRLGIELRQDIRKPVDNNFEITNNRIEQIGQAIIAYSTKNLLVRENDISVTATPGIGIGQGRGIRVEKNSIYASYNGPVNALDITSSALFPHDTTYVINNMISVAGNSTGGSKALNLELEDAVVANNSAYLGSTTQNSAVAAYFHLDRDSATILHYNNSYQTNQFGDVLHIDLETGVQSNFISDNNNYHSGRSNPFKHDGSRYTLANFRNTTTWDSNSIEVDPMYYSTRDLHINSKDLNAKGKPLSSVTDDYDKQLREPTPDIGADEIEVHNFDLRALGVDLSTLKACGWNDQSIDVIVDNFGNSQIDTFDVICMVKGPISDTITQTFNVSVIPDQRDTFSVDSFDFSQPGEYSIQFVVRDNLDSAFFNDTFTTSYTSTRNTGPIVSGYEGCENKSYIVTFYGPLGYNSYNWYNNPFGGSSISSSRIFSNVGVKTKSDSFYLELGSSNLDSLGPINDGTGSKYNSTELSKGLKFDVLEASILNSLNVKLASLNEVVQINIVNDDGILAYQKTFNATQVGWNTLNLQAYLPKGQNYVITATGTKAGTMMVNTSGLSYPYHNQDSSFVLKSDADGTLTEYPFFYNWKVSKASCFDRVPVIMSILKKPETPLIFVDSICAGDDLVAYTNDTANTHNWYTSSTQTTPFTTNDTATLLSRTSSGKIYVQVDSSNTCQSDRAEATYIVNLKPDSPLTIDSSNCSGDSIVLNYQSDSLTWLWHADSLRQQLILTGNYLVIHTANDTVLWASRSSNNCLSEPSKISIQSTSLPSPPIINGDTTYCFNDSLKFNSVDGRSYLWNYDSDYTLDSNSTFKSTHQNTGFHQLNISIAIGNCISSITKTIEVKANPIAPPAIDDSLCVGSDIVLSGNSNYTNFWYISNSSSSFDSSLNLQLQNLSGDTTLYLEHDSLGCRSDRVAQTLIVRDTFAPKVNDIYSDSACIGDSITLNLDPSSGSGHWYKESFSSDSLSTGSSKVFYQTSQSGKYLVFASNQYCSSDTQEINMAIHPIPNASFNYSISGNTLHLRSDSTHPNFSHTWEIEGQDEGSEDSLEYIASTNGTYQVIHTIIDQITGCEISDTQSVQMDRVGVHGVQTNITTLYPNPANEWFSIKFTKLPKTLYLYDQYGKLVKEYNLEDGNRFDIKGLASGIYVITYEIDNRIYQAKLVKRQ